MRQRIYDIINQTDETDKLGHAYSIAMLIVILLSLVPLLFKEEHVAPKILDQVCVIIFIIDYLLRLCTADFKYGKKNAASFLRYPFSAWAIIDLISILPSLTVLNNSFKMFRIFRMGRALRVFSVFKAFRYSKNFKIIANVFKRSRKSLTAVCTLTAAYIFVSAAIIFNVEPETFENFFSAIYWATISLTTVGYGDIYPVTTAGKIVCMCSTLVGIAIIALPASIITAGYMAEISGRDAEG